MESIECKKTQKQLVDGPMFKEKCYNKYRVSRFIFSPIDYETKKSPQNSGFSMNALTKYMSSAKGKNYKDGETTYYGVSKQIIKLDYIYFRQTLSYCDWFRVEDRSNGSLLIPRQT